MKALTLQQPWAWAVCHAGKRCENRAWLTAPGLLAVARSLVGQRFAVHAAAGTGTREQFHDAIEAMIIMGRGSMPDLEVIPAPCARRPNQWFPAADLPRGAIVATARLDDVVRTVPGGHRLDPDGVRCLACGALPISAKPPCAHADPWAIPGTIGLILADVRVLPVPVPCKGVQGWWTVPEGVEVPR